MGEGAPSSLGHAQETQLPIQVHAQIKTNALSRVRQEKN